MSFNRPLLLLVAILATMAPLTWSPPVARGMVVQYEAYVQRQQDLIALAGIFGQLHYLRRTCNPKREANIWRERMQTLIELEQPDRDTHFQMVTRFNEGFDAMGQEFPTCTREAQRRSKDLAFEGNAIVQRLTDGIQPGADTNRTRR
ncbi:MAG: TIGR02301 family protein [Pseudomonadota bacterium]